MRVCLDLRFYPQNKYLNVRPLLEDSRCVCPWWKLGCLPYRETIVQGTYTTVWSLWLLFSQIYFLYLHCPELFSSKTSCLLIQSTHLEWICDFQLAVQLDFLPEAKRAWHNWWVLGLSLTLLPVYFQSPCNSCSLVAFCFPQIPFCCLSFLRSISSFLSLWMTP